MSPQRNRLRACRSFLLTPGSRLEGFAAGGLAGGDALIIDLESTVAPDDKPKARNSAMAFLRQLPAADFVRMVRINSPHSIDGLRDLLALHECEHRPDALVIPKCESAEEIRLVVDLLDGTHSTIGIVPMVELARAIFVAHRMADAHERVCGLFFGGGDLAADLGAEGTWDNLLFARSRIVTAAATTGIAAIDVPYFEQDREGLEREAMAARKLGMTGKAALRVEHLPVINTLFTPSVEAVSRARSIIAARAICGTGMPVLAGHVVEPAMVREAERVLAITDRQCEATALADA
jgi:citrate lyase beta subunit